MAFAKDGEVKVFVNKNKTSDVKVAEELPPERYTVDDLVKDSKEEELEEKSDK